MISHEIIKKELKKLPFVKWDRYAEAGNLEGGHLQVYYGWIDREDSYKDFVTLFFENGETWFLTSSAKYTHKISRLLGMDGDDHKDCKRIEDLFPDLETAIKLKK